MATPQIEELVNLLSDHAKARIMELESENERLRLALDTVRMAKTRLNDFADKANAGQVHYDARELKRKIWAAFADFDVLEILP